MCLLQIFPNGTGYDDQGLNPLKLAVSRNHVACAASLARPGSIVPAVPGPANAIAALGSACTAPPPYAVTHCLAPLLLAMAPPDCGVLTHLQRFGHRNHRRCAMTRALLAGGASLQDAWTALQHAPDQLQNEVASWLPAAVRRHCRVLVLALARAFPITCDEEALAYRELSSDVRLRIVGLALRCDDWTLLHICQLDSAR